MSPTIIFAFLTCFSLAAANGRCRRRCNRVRCPIVSNCPGSLVRDACNCCDVCDENMGDLVAKKYFQPSNMTSLELEHMRGFILAENKTITDDPCTDIECKEPKMCVINVQHIPICKCPSQILCRKHRRAICGDDMVTYESRCHMRIAACNSGRRIRLAHRGACRDAVRFRLIKLLTSDGESGMRLRGNGGGQRSGGATNKFRRNVRRKLERIMRKY